MDAQDFRSLQEAYLEVYNEGLGGAKDASDKERLKNRLRDIETSTNASLDSIRNKTDRVSRRLKADQAQEFLKKHPRKKRTQKEEVDIYDIILSHLLDEGYAETQEAAEVIMVNMSEEWRESICEGNVSKKQQQKDAKTREKWYGEKAVKSGTDRFSQLQKKAIKSGETKLF